ncbi:MAG: response regulator [Candidatus Omnitrophica bacterium]|nr:response regulator [Candidatus Omnitrophota bacterium]
MSTKGLILIVDDEEDLREMLQFKFEAEGYAVATASNGMEGLEKLLTIKPDLIVLDMNMPRMGGIEFYNKICGNDSRPKYPVLVLTARANLESLFKDFAIDGFMTKPFDVDQLVKEVGLIIRKYRPVESERHLPVKSGVSRHVFIAEDDKAVFNKLAIEFLNAGYTVNSASTGAEAIERVAADVPDLVLIKLGLSDIPGDLVITRLRYMARTSHVEFLLYVDRKDNRTRQVMEKMAAKSHVFVEYDQPQELLEAADHAMTLKFGKSRSDDYVLRFGVR